MEMDLDEKSIVEALRSSPRLKACILEMIDITGEDSFEDLNLGDDAEEAVVSVIQKTGHTLLQDWAEKKVKKTEEEHKKSTVRPHKKKMRWQTSVGKIKLEKWSFLHRKKRNVNKRTFDPFVEKNGILNRSYSKRCQKLITDFGIEESFQMAVERMKEHHGVEINISAARNITQNHAKRAEALITEITPAKSRSAQMVMELDVKWYLL
jgi:hypothetical protein